MTLSVNRRITALVGVMVLFLAACAKGAPDLDLGQDEVDLGQVINGQISRIEVPVQNAGNAPLKIEAVSTSCGCTTATVEPLEIPAGGTGTLRVEFDSGAHGPEANGPVMRQVFIASNDPNLPEAEFRIVAEVLPAP